MLMPTAWRVVHVPLWDEESDRDEVPPDRFCRTGVRVEFSDGVIVFWSYRHGSYTVTMPPAPVLERWSGRQARDSAGRLEFSPGRKTRSDGLRELCAGHSVVFVAGVLRGIRLAEEDDAAKRCA